MTLQLIIGNKNYSSWSMRPWIAMKVKNIPFDEMVIPLDEPDSKEKYLSHSPAGRVPVLIDGNVRVWESLAILEYLAEKFPDHRLWPVETAMRAHARTISNEMHAGFQSLRQQCPMNIRRPVRKIDLNQEATENVRRIDTMWNDCRTRFKSHGPFLFGQFSIADAMYAPVVSRLYTYAIDISPLAREYINTMMSLPAWKVWSDTAAQEKWALAKYEAI